MKRVGNKGVICFFCLRRVREYYIVDYEVKELGMVFKVYACPDCYARIKDASRKP
ncbi:MAG: hypothetical protein RXN89_04170 [Vulcanisaeta sp.]|jgi:hypothetical protein|uniref:hypothetical protein n=1 Tax=Vulcanisaeta sp. EB80 TaxID=1650660 RepID=UPI00192E328E|nr:hypothetical protein [Vulcanisaeta sp. EB80]MCG2864340.1 hypothetical protein [Vulcanisaeta sp.]MCG2866090.1 hypothetical protein [Vulcanisaeta sp.]MCG2884968.1 hypothetical protein [Vulcanisaeta sp.]MDT7863816.1 hypothetical protein [Vulcanisaeta sp.]